MEATVKRVALQTLILRRNGAQFVPAIGDVVELTTEELAQINEVNPAAIGKIEVNASVARAVVEQAVDMDAIRAEALAQARAELAEAAAAETKPAAKPQDKKATGKKDAKTDADDDI